MAEKKKKSRHKLKERKPLPKVENSFFSSRSIQLLEDFTLFLLFLSLSLLFSTGNIVAFTLPKLVALRIGTLILILLFGWRLYKKRIRPIPKSVLFIGILMGLWWIFSTFFALHLPTALNGAFGRYNGLWTQMILLLLFFLVASISFEIIRTERMLKLFVVSLIPVALYAVIQSLQLDPIAWSTRWSRSVSTIGHGVPLAALLGLALPFVLAFLFTAVGSWEKAAWGLVFLFFLWAVLSTLSRGPWIGILLSSLPLTLYLFRKNRPKILYLKTVLVWTLPVVLMVIALVFIHTGTREKISGRLETFLNLSSDTSFQGRIMYSQAAWEGVKDHPWVGICFENFRNIYPQYRGIVDNQIFQDTIPTMVHNGYLQIALSSGVLGLVLYLAFLMLIFLRLWKSFQRSGEGRGKVLLLAFMASFFGFLIQDLSGWPDIALTPFFWILLGLGLSFCLTDQPQRPEKFGRIAAYFLWAIFGGSVLFLGFLIPDAFNRLAADRLFGVSQRLSIAEEWPEIESNITKAVQRVPRDAHYQDLCGVYYIRRLGLTGEPVLYREGAAFLKKAHSLNPFDPYVLIHRIDLDQVALAKGLISEAARETQQAMFKLQAMDRNNPTIYRAMAKLKIREKKYSEALALIDQANRLNRAAPNPREEWTAAQHGRFLELVKEREYPSAQKVLQEVITQYPDDSPTYVLMGNLFLAMNKPDKARESFQAALDLDKDNRDAQEGLKKIGATSGNSLSQ